MSQDTGYDIDKHFSEIENIALESATLFNRVIRNGKTIQEYTNEELVEAFKTQLHYVATEEVCEWLTNYNVDKVEELDAIADVLYTVPYLFELSDELMFRGVEYDCGKDYHKYEVLFDLYGGMFEPLLTVDWDLELVEEAVERVCDNNMQKFTTDYNEFITWENPDDEELIPKTFVCDGITYYALVNEKGKVRKRKGFTTVDLSDLVS